MQKQAEQVPTLIKLDLSEEEETRRDAKRLAENTILLKQLQEDIVSEIGHQETALTESIPGDFEDATQNLSDCVSEIQEARDLQKKKVAIQGPVIGGLSGAGVGGWELQLY